MLDKIKSGMLVITRDNTKWLVVDTQEYGLILRMDSGYMRLNEYDNNLRVNGMEKSRYNIMKFGTTSDYGTILNKMRFDKVLYENDVFERVIQLEHELEKAKKELENW